uniref:Coiled-coil domain-containing protein 134 n=2 Tax=Clytia hemisphaerica TaxID=252671 RepID=A0A7M6DR17_9CNID
FNFRSNKTKQKFRQLKMLRKYLLLYWLLAFTANYVSTDEVVVKREETATSLNITKKELYKYGFQVKRAEQIEGVKRIMKIDNYEKQFKMVKLLVEKLFNVLSTAKVQVTEFGYIPGGEFPDDQSQLDALGRVFENVAMFGDLILRLPDITHKLYDKNQEWKVIMTWGVFMANESGIFEGSNEQLLDLMSQELNITPRGEDYINPYKEETRRKEEARKEKEKLKKERQAEQKKKAKRDKRKNRKGPKLGGGGGGRRTDL